MGMPRIVYIARLDAYQRICDEASHSPGRETGGILVGRMFQLRDGLCLVVVAASGPGANADRRPHTYAPDPTTSQRDLEAWRNHYRAYGVDYVGEWHKHPPGIQQPSAGDTLQVIDILSDDSYKLPDGIYTPLVTIEDERLLLHSYYYPRETVRPTPVRYEIIDGDIRTLLGELTAVEQQAAQPTQPSKGNRWGVAQESLQAARSELAIPVAEVITPESLPDEQSVIDMTGGQVPPSVRHEGMPVVPPFPGPPDPDQVPPAPPLPGRAAREQSDLEQFCNMRKGKLTRHSRDDGSFWYAISFATPLPLQAQQFDLASSRRTAEGTVTATIASSEISLGIVELDIDPGHEFPEQPPEVTVQLTDNRRLRVLVPQLFPNGWRSHRRLRDVVSNLLEAMSQPRAPQELAALLEFQGRLVIRQMEETFRSVADLCAELNRTYTFQPSGPFTTINDTEQKG
jgi:hypothetical protein